MPLGTVITRFRSPASITTYAVITLVIDPIGRSVTDDLDHRSRPVASFASSAHRARTPAGLELAGWAGLITAAPAGEAPATMIPAAIPATTAPAASRPAIRIPGSS